MQVLGCSAQTGLNGVQMHIGGVFSLLRSYEEEMVGVIERSGEVCYRPTRQGCTQPRYVRGLVGPPRHSSSVVTGQ